MSELKPCPFCGHEAVASYSIYYGFQVYCSNEDCFMSQNFMSGMWTEEEMVEAWNRRAE